MGYHDPKDLWPHDEGGWASFRRAGMATFFLGPAVALATLAWAVVRTRQGIALGDMRRTAPASWPRPSRSAPSAGCSRRSGGR